MFQRKKDRYAEYLEEMAQQNLRYVPVVLSCYGRLHPEAADTLDRVALQAGRRQGVWNYGSLRRRAAAALGVAVVSRAVAMARACLPRLQKETLELLFEEGLDCEETAGGGGGDAEALEELAGYSGGRGGGATAGNASLSSPGRPGACTSRSPRIID